MKKKKENINVVFWLGLVLLISLLLRIFLFKTYPPQSFSDTGGYWRSAQAVLNGFTNYDGTRTPVYPIFIALLRSERVVYAGQLALGLLITLAWFLIGWKMSGRPFFGALSGFAYTLNPGQFFFEANLLTETLAAFWLVLSLLGAYFWLANVKNRSIWLSLGIGLSASLAVLTRPQFIFMPFWIALFLAFSYHDRKLSFNWKPFLGILLPALIVVGGWMGWIQSRYHILSVTTMSGFHMVQHSGYYFEDVPDQYQALRDVYLDYRDQRLEEYGTQSNTIWGAIPAMQKATGMSFYDLSRTLQEISIRLIIRHPWQYLLNVVQGWWWFWRAPVYWNKTALTIHFLPGIMQVWVLGARGLMFLSNMIFIISSAAAILSERLRKFFKLGQFHWLLAGSIWITSLLTSLLEHGENQRFLIPLQTAVLFWVLWFGYAVWKSQKENHAIPAKI
jgi:hypothetical protein